jgi:5-oxoprolinase (ATP-hydrolysing)
MQLCCTLPDLTVVTPIFSGGEIIFYVASRGHHSDIGGIGITSIVPDSKGLWQEGISIKSMRIVEGGHFKEKEIRQAFEDIANHMARLLEVIISHPPQMCTC